MDYVQVEAYNPEGVVCFWYRPAVVCTTIKLTN